MSNIPTVPGSEISYDTPAKAVPLNAGALAAARYRGAEALGRGMEDIGNEAGALAEHLQKARELGIAADVDLKLRTARQTFLESLKGDSNEQDWVNRAQVTATETRDYIYASHDGIPQRMRPQIDAALKGWEGSLLTETQTLSNVQTVNRAWGSVQKDVRDAVDNGHADHAFTLLEQARQKKLTDPAVIDQMQRDIPKGIAQTYIERGFSANPQQTTELLKSGGSLPAEDQDGKPIVPKNIFTPKEMEALINTGRIRSDAWQRTNFETMLREDQDPVTVLPEAVIKQKMTSKEITEKAGQNQIAAQDRKVKATTAEAAHLLKLEDDRLEGNLLTRIP